MNFADLQSDQRYRRVAAYGQSKLANLMFSYELQRRLAAAGARPSALAAHPGTAITALTRYFPPAVDRVYHAMGQPIAQQRAVRRAAHAARGHRPGGARR